MPRLFVGTDKGAFVMSSNEARTSWTIDGPHFKGWKATAFTQAPDGAYIAATASDVYGPALHRSTDLSSWEQVVDGPAYSEGSDRKLKQVWTMKRAGDRLYAGVDEAGLFASDDDGRSWSGVEALNEHETRSAWFPGAGGLCLHAILVDPADPGRIWCGISAVGVFRSDDGGATWTPKNEGIPALIEDETHKDIGRCVHGLAADPDDADVIYRREHNGMFRSTDGGEHWERIENGLASWFGFPIAIDRPTKTIYVVPLESDEYRLPVDGRLQVYRSRDGGDSWQETSRGLPERNAYMGVLRGAMAVDEQQPCGVYLGTTAGTVHASNDGGGSWTQLPCYLPRIFCVEVV